MKKQIFIGVLLVAAGAVLAHLYVVSQTYHPVARVSSPDGLVFTAVQDPTADRQACGAANDRFLNPVKQLCTQCKVVLARCERELEPFELDIAAGKTARHPIVSARGLRIAVEGPAEAAKASCELMASSLQKSGVGPAVCLQSRPVKEKAP